MRVGFRLVVPSGKTPIEAPCSSFLRARSKPGSLSVSNGLKTLRKRGLAGLRAIAAEGVPDVVLSRGLAVWAQLFGSISFELFGHLHNVVHDFDAMFRHQMRRAGRYLVTGA